MCMVPDGKAPSPGPKPSNTSRTTREPSSWHPATGSCHERRQAPCKPRQGARKPIRHLGPCCGHRSRCGRFAVGDQAWASLRVAADSRLRPSMGKPESCCRLIPQATLTKPGCNRLLQLFQKSYILRKIRYFLKIRLFSFKSCHLFKCRNTLTL